MNEERPLPKGAVVKSGGAFVPMSSKPLTKEEQLRRALFAQANGEVIVPPGKCGGCGDA
jgi:2-phospho-L-lactate guanylyltransferase (CobY/MobA/RfbA family)